MKSSRISFTGKRAIMGALLSGIAVAILSLGVVRAERETIAFDNQVYKCSSGSACVEGDAKGKNVIGVLGQSTAGNGIEGQASHNDTAGVAGYWQNAGSSGTKKGIGVYGYAGGSGSLRTANGAYGLWAEVNAASSSSAAVYAQTDGGANIFTGVGQSHADHCIIDSTANLSCTGAIQGATPIRVRQASESGRSVTTYTPESATATIEDVGTARMSGGVANVKLDAAFAAATDRRWYYVFLTPLGDTGGLYVSMKTPLGFQVRETEHGRSNLEFDYRVVAHPYGAKYDRLPEQ